MRGSSRSSRFQTYHPPSSSTRDRDYTSRYSSSRYSDYSSSKSSMFRGLFDKTFSRFFGGRNLKLFSLKTIIFYCFFQTNNHVCVKPFFISWLSDQLSTFPNTSIHGKYHDE
jgi:hypothetical protein